MARAPAFQAGTPLHKTPQKNDLDDAADEHQRKPQQCAAETAAPTDPDLCQVIDAWPTLPEAVRAGIVAMVKASGNAPAGKAGKGSPDKP
jgi:hypothetical protein